MPRSTRNLTAAIVLVFTAPLVAEYLLGDLPLKLLGALVALAPMYGGGALLIREIARRRGLGWRGILVLGVAYTVIEEGFTTQSLFNPDYLKLHMHFLSHAAIPVLGIGGWWTLFMLNLHTFWSISVSIALVEGLFPAWADRPWLGKAGDSVVGALFLLGCVASTAISLKMDRFVASHMQLGVTALVALLVIAVALRLPRPTPPRGQLPVPSPWATGATTLLLGLGVLLIPATWNWGAVAAMLGIDLVFLGLLAVFSRRTGWTRLHALSLAAGGALAYGLHAFLAKPLMGSVLAARISNAVFLALALAVIAAAVRRTARASAVPEPVVAAMHGD
ncbi:MAG TPA: hypothetical protein VHX60_07415 [Acidobacteriaceae bacterium]|jgi:hypothetical protein|nr:hypothetical protein [Acidobacteriaceae bacterium]